MVMGHALRFGSVIMITLSLKKSDKTMEVVCLTEGCGHFNINMIKELVYFENPGYSYV